MIKKLNLNNKITKVAIIPAILPHNDFVPLFANAVRATGREVIDAQWKIKTLVRADQVIIHWPDFFFKFGDERRAIRNLVKMFIARKLFGTKFIWVAHNLTPHGSGKISRFAQRFFSQLEGILHLSSKGHELLNSNYDIPSRVRQAVTVHGRYPTLSQPQEPKYLAHHTPVKLLTFGQLRPYKNIEAVLVSHAGLDDPSINLHVAGLAVDSEYISALNSINSEKNVIIDARFKLIDTLELENFVDDADLVILPYHRILNSGAAFFALSRNRPIVAPFAGALPELRDIVGHEWIFLYHGDLTTTKLMEAVDWCRLIDRTVPPNLESYSWDRVSRDVNSFLCEIEAG